MTIRQYIQKYILLKIVSEEWEQGEILPSENQLAKKFSCSRIIARQALTTFVAAGILKAQKGRGYVIIPEGVQDFLESNTQKYNVIDSKIKWLNSDEKNEYYNSVKKNYINKTNYMEDFNPNEMEIVLKEYFDEKGLVCVQLTFLKKDLVDKVTKKKLEKSFSKSMVEYAIVATSKRKEFFPVDDSILKKYKKELGWNQLMITSICELFMESELLEVSTKIVRRDKFYGRAKQEILL